jgi:hypothetical protein
LAGYFVNGNTSNNDTVVDIMQISFHASEKDSEDAEIAHIIWHDEWRKVFWSGEVTFLVGGRRKLHTKEGKNPSYLHATSAPPTDSG